MSLPEDGHVHLQAGCCGWRAAQEILIVGGSGVVGRRIAVELVPDYVEAKAGQ